MPWARKRPASTAADADALATARILHVIAHVEHDPAGEEHGAERQHDGEQREPRELQANRGQKLEEQGHDQADAERGPGDDERELDHGENR